MARAGHRIGVALLAAAALATCGGPAPSTRPSAPAAPPVADGCVDLGEEVWGLSWSPGGAYLAVATYAGEGDAHAWVMAPDGRLTAETVAVTHLVMQSLVVSPDGWRTWLVAKDPASPRHTLVEDRLLGRRETPLSGPISSIGWTARGYAMVEKRQAGDAVLLLNPDRPSELEELHAGDGGIDRLWVSADANVLVLTTGNGSSDAHVKVIDGTRVHAIDLRAGDATGTSLIGAHLVYHAISGEMVVVPVDDPESPSQLSDRRARLGMVSDHGILALASVDRPGSVCLENVIANVR